MRYSFEFHFLASPMARLRSNMEVTVSRVTTELKGLKVSRWASASGCGLLVEDGGDAQSGIGAPSFPHKIYQRLGYVLHAHCGGTRMRPSQKLLHETKVY